MHGGPSFAAACKPTRQGTGKLVLAGLRAGAATDADAAMSSSSALDTAGPGQVHEGPGPAPAGAIARCSTHSTVSPRGVYAGQWRAGQRHGQGRLQYGAAAGGGEYDGAWVDDERHGLGTMVCHPHSGPAIRRLSSTPPA